MKHFLNTKRKKSPEPLQYPASPVDPTNVIAGPSGSQPEYATIPEGGQGRSHSDPEVDYPDLTAVLDDTGHIGPRIVSQDRMDEDQELPALGASTSGGVGRDRNRPMSEHL